MYALTNEPVVQARLRWLPGKTLEESVSEPLTTFGLSNGEFPENVFPASPLCLASANILLPNIAYISKGIRSEIYAQ